MSFLRSFYSYIQSWVGVMIFFGYFLIYVVRYNLSVHVVDMLEMNKKFTLVPPYDNYSLIFRKRIGNIIEIMHWSEERVSLLLAAYFIGFCICFPIFHNMGDRFGPTWVTGVAGFISGVLNCLTPAAAYYNYWLMFWFRVLNGFCAGAMQPSMVQVLRYWVPPTERHHFMWAYCGWTTGTCSTFIICAGLQYYYGWAVGFYSSGAAQILWAVIWIAVITDTPSKHTFISQKEKHYITTAVGAVFTIKLTNNQAPWPLILRSMPFWAVCILGFGYAWMLISICLHGTMYYTLALEYCIYKASALTALPFLLRLVLGTISIETYHWYKNNTNIRRIKHIKKYFIVVSHIIPGLVLCSAWFLPIYPGPVLLTAIIALTSAGMDLTLDFCYDLSPTYVNSIHTIIKIISNVPGIIIPICVGQVIREHNNTINVWTHIWCFHATVLLLSGLIFLVCGNTEIQPWNEIRQRPQRRMIPIIRPSTMSNIPEIEEEDVSSRTSYQGHYRLSNVFKSLR